MGMVILYLDIEDTDTPLMYNDSSSFKFMLEVVNADSSMLPSKTPVSVTIGGCDVANSWPFLG